MMGVIMELRISSRLSLPYIPTKDNTPIASYCSYLSTVTR